MLPAHTDLVVPALLPAFADALGPIGACLMAAGVAGMLAVVVLVVRSNLALAIRRVVVQTGASPRGEEDAIVKYLLMLTDIAGKWDTLPPQEQTRIIDAHDAFGEALRAEKRFVSAFRLRPPGEAKTLHFVNPERRDVTDGPFTETKEVMGGYYVIEAGSIDEAVAWARRLPLAYGSIEVRPVWE